jgi:hypothetical protein
MIEPASIDLFEWQSEVLAACSCFGCLLESGVTTVERVCRLLTVEDLLDSQDLNGRVGRAIRRFVESGFGAASRSIGFVGSSKQMKMPSSAFRQ